METRQSLTAELKELEGGIAFNVERRMEISSGIRELDTALRPWN
jgi:hypothetical protein